MAFSLLKYLFNVACTFLLFEENQGFSKADSKEHNIT